jgi:hypothetical protein
VGDCLDPPVLADLRQTVRKGVKCHCATRIVPVEGYSSHRILTVVQNDILDFGLSHFGPLLRPDQMEPLICCRRTDLAAC